MNTTSKVNYLLRLLLDKDFSIQELNCGIVSPYWKIGTSIYNTFKRMYENLVSLNKPIDRIKIRLYEDKTYFQALDSINVTPTTCKQKMASYSAMSQYIRMLQAFNIITIKQRKNNLTEFIKLESDVYLVFDAIDKLKKRDKEFILMLENFLSNAFFQEISTTRDICLSILIEILIKFHFDFSTLNSHNDKISSRKIAGKSNQKEQKYFLLSNIDDYIKFENDIRKQGSNATYKEISDLAIKYYDSLEKFIDKIYDLIQSKREHKNNISSENNIAKLDIERSKFKNNIFEDRKNKNLITKWEDDYSDVCDLENDLNNLQRPFNQANASHLFEYNQIKKNLDQPDKINEKDVSNPHNGLIMPIEYHNSFDRRQWTFDNNGVMIYDAENEHLIFNRLKLQRIKIRNEVLSEQMKDYIFKRNQN